MTLYQVDAEPLRKFGDEMRLASSPALART